MSAGKIIENGHLETVLLQKTHRGATNVACASGNQNVFRHLSAPNERVVSKERRNGPIRACSYDVLQFGFFQSLHYPIKATTQDSSHVPERWAGNNTSELNNNVPNNPISGNETT